MEMKPFLAIEEQISLLKSRGLIIDDETLASEQLHNLNYYRLSGYTLTLRKNNAFYKDIHFSNLMDIYNFDRELKVLLLYLLEDVEISLRTHIAYVLGRRGANSYLDHNNFASREHYERFSKELHTALSDNKNEAFVKHHRTRYEGVLPVWAIVETLSFGAVSRLFTSLNVEIKKEICKLYYNNIRYTYIENWIEVLMVVRNLCAHHSRIFNRGLPKSVKFSQDDFDFLRNCGFDSNAIGKKLFFAVIVLERIDPSSTGTFKTNFLKLMDKYPFVDIRHYGFLKEWKSILISINSKYER